MLARLAPGGYNAWAMKIATLNNIDHLAQAVFRRDFRVAPSHLRAGGAWEGTGASEQAIETQMLVPWPVAREFFLAYGDDGELLASCAASLSLTDVTRGFIGFFEAAESPNGKIAARMLLTQAQTWLRAAGASHAVGPVNLCTWFPYRFQAEAYEGDAMGWEPRSPLFYLELWSQAGFVPVESYFSEASRLVPAALTKNAPALVKAEAHGYRFRPFACDPHRLMLDEVPILHELTLAAFADNFLFEPLPLALFRQLYVPLLDKLTSVRFSWFVFDPHGQPCGFLFAFEDNAALVAKTVGVIPAHRGNGLQMALLQQALIQAQSEGIEIVISALLKEGIASERIPALFATTGGALWRHHYLLMEKVL